MLKTALSLTAVISVLLLGRVQARSDQCPLTISSLTLAAKGATGASVLYRIDLLSPDAQPHWASFSVRVSDADQPLSITGADIRPEAQKSGPAAATYWFERPRADVTAASIASVSPQSAENAAPQQCVENFVQTASGDPAITIVSVYDDTLVKRDASAPVLANDVVEATPAPEAAEIRDADFLAAVQPNYPAMAMQQGLEGDVVVGVVIGPGGALKDAWVISQSGIPVLDASALAAARASKFRGPTRNGEPTTHTYLIVYSFRVEDGTNAFTSAEQRECGLEVGSPRLQFEDAVHKVRWYSVTASSKNDRPSSAELGIVDDQGQVADLEWPSLSLHQRDKSYDAHATFNWGGAPIVAAWVDDWTDAAGVQKKCIPWVMKTDTSASPPPIASAVVGNKVPLVSPQTVMPARFGQEVWPAYAAAMRAAHATGLVGVQVAVDGVGKPVEAHVNESSGKDTFDHAALAAAMQSTYVVKLGTELYEVYYKFGD